MNNQRGSRGRKSNELRERGRHATEFAKSVKTEATRLQGHGCTQDLVDGAAPFYYDADVTETAETHIVPRQSLGRKQLLGVFSRSPLDKPEDMHFAQAEKRTFWKNASLRTELTGEMIAGTNSKIRKLSDTTLLRRGNPFAYPSDFKRSTSRSKSIEHDRAKEINYGGISTVYKEDKPKTKAELILDIDDPTI